MNPDRTPLSATLTIAQLREMYSQGSIAPEAVMAGIVERARSVEGMNIWITPPYMERIAPYLERLRERAPSELP
ncbi:hypothetical protein U6Q21_12555, partial [Cutibacterium acnes]